MSTDHDFEQVLSARLGAAAEPVTGSGVTMATVEARVAERRAGRRRRQGALAIVAAAVVVLGGVGLAAAVDRDRPASVVADDGTSSTEAPTTEAPTTTDCLVTDAGVAPGTSLSTTTVMIDETDTTMAPTSMSTTTVPADVEGTGPEAPVPCAPSTTTTEPPSTTTETTAPAPTTETTAPPSTGEPATTLPAAYPGAACTPGSHEDCIDPEGDGSYVHLIGGADCMASPIGGPMCADLDGDGHAGYPDSEG